MFASFKRYSAYAALVLISFAFQNCSQPNRFTGNESAASSQAAAPPPLGPALASGGEGYGGKPYPVVSPSNPCSDSAMPPSQVEVASDRTVLLTARNCQTLITPEPIAVLFAADPRVLFYNGQTYREEGSNVPFESPLTEWMTIEVEDFARLPTSGGGVSGGVLRITDDDYASTPVTFVSSGIHRFTVLAEGDSAYGEDAVMELRIDGVVMGQVSVGELFADYSFEVNVSAGRRTVALAFTNDTYDRATKADRNLKLDRLTIAK
jgi:hypothetical protein